MTTSPLRKKRSPLRLPDEPRLPATSLVASPLRKKRSPLRLRVHEPSIDLHSRLHRFERSGLHCGVSRPALRPIPGLLHRFERSGLHCGCSAMGLSLLCSVSSPLRKKRSPLRPRRRHEAPATRYLHRFERSGLHCGPHHLSGIATNPLNFTASKEAVSIAASFARSVVEPPCSSFTASKEAVSIAAKRTYEPLMFNSSSSFTASKEAVSIAAHPSIQHASSCSRFLHRFERSGLHCGPHHRPCRRQARNLHRFERSGLHCGNGAHSAPP